MMIYFLGDSAAGIVTFFGVLAAFALTVLFTKCMMSKLPTDIGRAYAVNAAAAKGKPRGAGIIFVLVYVVCILIFVPLSVENLIYCILLVAAMLSGFLDDASRIPWSDYKKGLIDLFISLGITLTFALTNSTRINFLIIGKTAELPLWLYLILGTVLVWASINVTNCTDGVDGLSSSLSLISLGGFAYIFLQASSSLGNSGLLPGAALLSGTDGPDSSFTAWILIFMACIAAYLLFNAGPSILLMGDAGSRTIGVFFALAAMKTGAPLLFLPLCLVFILDGGLGLIKIALLRFLKIKFMTNIRTPLHDHARKNKGWSDTHTVIRFCVLHLVVVFITLALF